MKPIAAADYTATFMAAELQQLQSIFPSGVCNFAVPGVGQVPTAGTWQRL